MRRNRINFFALTLACAAPGLVRGQISSWIGPAAGNWDTPSNWSDGLPTASSDVFIDAGNAQNSVVTITSGLTRNSGTLTLSAGDELIVSNNSFIQLNGADTRLNNSGTLSLNSTGSSTRLRFIITGTGTISGGGTILLAGSALIDGTVGARAFNADNSIIGAGAIGGNTLAFTNQALISAQNGTLTIDPGNVASAFVNTGTLQAINGGTLVLTGSGSGAFFNAGGTISIVADSHGYLTANANLSGGTLSTTGSGVMHTAAGQNATIANITNTGNFTADNNSNTTLSGTITNIGSINLASTGSTTDLTLDGGTVTLTGGGSIALQGTALASPARIHGAGTLVNVNNAIRGEGTLGANSSAIRNLASGLIEANVNGKMLALDPGNVTNAFVNDGVLRASNGGTLLFTGSGLGSFFNNNLIEAHTGSQVRFTTIATLTGGTFSTSGTGTIAVATGQIVFFNNIANLGHMVAENNTDFGIAGAIHNAGSINIQASTSQTDIEVQTDTTLTGGGAITLVDTDAAILNQAGINGLPGMRLTNVNNVIQGHGGIGRNVLAITNGAAGLVHANVPGGILTLDPGNVTNAFVNDGVLRASNGGTLLFTGSGLGSFFNNNLIEALDASQVRFTTIATLTGGTFSTSGTGTIAVATGHNVFFNNIANLGHMVAENNTDTGISGVIHNAGSINILATTAQTDIELQTDSSLTGGGTVTLADLDATIADQAGINGIPGARLTNVNNVIQGHGGIGRNAIAMTNDPAGTIHANVSGGTLTLDPANVANGFVNNGTLRASNGGTLVLTGSGLGSFSGSGSIAADATVHALTNASVTSGPIIGAGTMMVSGNSTVAAKHYRVANLVVSSGTASVATNGADDGASRVDTLSITGGARVDLNDNDLIVTTTPVATVQGLIVQARNGGAWNGAGLTSSAAKSASPANKTLGLLTGAEYLSVNGPLFNGLGVSNTDTLVKFTYYGDTDFNGVINFDDYARIDVGFLNNRTGWLNGDFNYSGSVNFDDYALIDQAFLSQTGDPLRGANWLNGGGDPGDIPDDPAMRAVAAHYQQFGDNYANSLLSIVPEPNGVLAAALLGAIGARRRRR